jgi:hypothetical protein
MEFTDMARFSLVCALLSGILWIASWPTPILPSDKTSNGGFPNSSHIVFDSWWHDSAFRSEYANLALDFRICIVDSHSGPPLFKWDEQVKHHFDREWSADATPFGDFYFSVSIGNFHLSLPYWLVLFGWIFCFAITVRTIRFRLLDLILAAIVVGGSLALVKAHCTMVLAVPVLFASVGAVVYTISLALWRLARSQAPSLLFARVAETPDDE